jgi:hypothetical protein
VNRTAGVILFCVVLGFASAQTAARPQGADGGKIWTPQLLLKFDDPLPEATVPKEMIPSVRISDVKVTLEHTELEAMEARFGGEIGSEGDAGESIGWLCLHGNDAVGPWVLWLLSDEIDGPYVGGFEWARVSRSSQFDERCAALPDPSRVELPIQLRLDTPEARVLQLLGRPTFRKDKVLAYEHEHDETIRGEPFISDNGVYIAIRDGKVWAINVWKTTSN